MNPLSISQIIGLVMIILGFSALIAAQYRDNDRRYRERKAAKGRWHRYNQRKENVS